MTDVKRNFIGISLVLSGNSRRNRSNTNLFLTEYVTRHKAQYMQGWRSVCVNSSKLQSYCQFKLSFGPEEYLHHIDIYKFRRVLAMFRCSSDNLMLEVGRYYNIPSEHRFCIYCECIVEDEIHFLLVCPLYDDLRTLYINNTLQQMPLYRKFSKLMSSTDQITIRQLAMYLYFAFQRRNEYMSSVDS